MESSRDKRYAFQIAKQLCHPSFSQASIEKLQVKRTAEPHNPVYLESLAAIFRRIGDLSSAAQVYEDWHSLEPQNPKVKYLSALFSQREELPSLTTMAPPWPVPFVLLENFFSVEQNREILSYALANQERFLLAEVAGREKPIDLDVRYGLRCSEIGEWNEFFRELAIQQLEKILPRLCYPSFPVGRIEVKMTSQMDQCFFVPHTDNLEEEFYGSWRQINFLYYFHQSPKQFQEGDLLLYDTDLSTGTHNYMDFTRITPQNNSLVFFPSRYYHSVTPVQLPSQQFEEGRFAVSGNIHVQNEYPAFQVSEY